MSGHTLLTLCGPPTGHVRRCPPKTPQPRNSCPFLSQVECRHCRWVGTKHATRGGQIKRGKKFERQYNAGKNFALDRKSKGKNNTLRNALLLLPVGRKIVISVAGRLFRRRQTVVSEEGRRRSLRRRETVLTVEGGMFSTQQEEVPTPF